MYMYTEPNCMDAQSILFQYQIKYIVSTCIFTLIFISHIYMYKNVMCGPKVFTGTLHSTSLVVKAIPKIGALSYVQLNTFKV